MKSVPCCGGYRITNRPKLSLQHTLIRKSEFYCLCLKLVFVTTRTSHSYFVLVRKTSGNTWEPNKGFFFSPEISLSLLSPNVSLCCTHMILSGPKCFCDAAMDILSTYFGGIIGFLIVVVIILIFANLHVVFFLMFVFPWRISVVSKLHHFRNHTS